MATIQNLLSKPAPGEPMRPCAELRLEAAKGIVGDAHASPRSLRQVLMVGAEALAALGTVPGALRENITVSGLDVDGLASGTAVLAGTALLRVTYRCDPCETLRGYTGITPEQARGRRGVLAIVVGGGLAAVGDRIEVLGQRYDELPSTITERLHWFTERIPPGKVVSYGEAAAAIGAPRQAVRTFPRLTRQLVSEGLPGHRLVPLGELADDQRALLGAEGVDAALGTEALSAAAWAWWEPLYGRG